MVGGNLALAHGFGQLKGLPGAVSGGVNPWQIGGHKGIHLYIISIQLQPRHHLGGGDGSPQQEAA